MKYTLFFLIIFLTSSSAKAQDCIVQNTQDILKCALQRHPDIRENSAIVNRDQKLSDAARQLINPELETKVVAGDLPGGSVLNTETTLLQTLQLGGKRKSLFQQSKAQGNLAQAHLNQTRDEVALQTVLAAHRLRQIRVEEAAIEQSSKTLNQIITRHREKSILSPEQEVSLNIFEAGQQELLFKRASLTQEKSELLNYLITATGNNSKTLLKYLPPPKTKWPALKETESLEIPLSETSSLNQEAQAELELARANSQVAHSMAWPDLKIGPTIETERQANDTSILTGGTIEIPLPFLSLNRGNKAYAKLEEQRALIHLEALREKMGAQRQNQIIRYRSAVKVLNKMPTQKYENMSDLFEAGLIPLSLLMEANRQKVEITEMRHVQELIALEALWTILIIDGRVMEGTL